MIQSVLKVHLQVPPVSVNKGKHIAAVLEIVPVACGDERHSDTSRKGDLSRSVVVPAGKRVTVAFQWNSGGLPGFVASLNMTWRNNHSFLDVSLI